MTIRITAALTALVAAACVAVVALHISAVRAPAPVVPSPAPPLLSTAWTAPPQDAGIVTENLVAFDRACKCRPDVAVHYVHWGLPADMLLPRIMLANGAVPLLELEPYGITLTSIANGRQDRWLRNWAKAIGSLRTPVLMSFAPEANGDWYTWGYHHASARTFVAAWRHVVTVFRAAAHQVSWIWVINRAFSHSEPLRRIWPGRGYVSMVGIDGYFGTRSDTFASLFGPTIKAIRHFTRIPIVITEVAAKPRAGKARAVTQLIAGIRDYHLVGFIWFDVNQASKRHPIANIRADWRLETDRTALAEFRRFVTQTIKALK